MNKNNQIGQISLYVTAILIISSSFSGCNNSSFSRAEDPNLPIRFVHDDSLDVGSDIVRNSGLSYGDRGHLTSEIKAKKERSSVTQAMYASKTNFMCPKLLKKPIDDVRIYRRNEVMKNDYCEYYLYPKKGQTINVISEDRRLEKLLVTPTIHNFENGLYVTKGFDKHTIRLNYSSIERKPNNFKYDVEIIIQD